MLGVRLRLSASELASQLSRYCLTHSANTLAAADLSNFDREVRHPGERGDVDVSGMGRVWPGWFAAHWLRRVNMDDGFSHHCRPTAAGYRRDLMQECAASVLQRCYRSDLMDAPFLFLFLLLFQAQKALAASRKTTPARTAPPPGVHNRDSLGGVTASPRFVVRWITPLFSLPHLNPSHS